MRLFLAILSLVFSANVFAAAKKKPITYFSCVVNEPSTKPKAKKTDTVEVTVKFAVEGLDIWKEKGKLITYPGLEADEESYDSILVTPNETGESIAICTNLNSQGGDLRLEGNNIRLWGDGDGYQFTDLVIWDVDTEEQEEGEVTELEGYIRDYGSAYGDSETFKQFIKCKRSVGKVL